MPGLLLVCQDLIFQTKIAGTAAALDIPCRTVASAAVATGENLSEVGGAVVDLATCPTDGDLASLRSSLPAESGLLAFGSHVEAERLRAARAAGCDPVLPRSRFAERLPDLLRELVR